MPRRNPHPINCYVTDHPHSQVVCNAFAQGFGAQIVPAGRLLPGAAMVYGVLRGCGDIIHQCRWVGRDFYHMDNGYFGRGHYEGYYRITKNGIQYTKIDENATPERFEPFGIKLSVWKKGGRHILVTPITQGMATFWMPGVKADVWMNTVVEEISRHTDRPIVIKQKGNGTIDESLKDAWCLVTHSSISALDALRCGIPVVSLGESCAAPLSTPLERIESPCYGSREPLFWTLANHQWTLNEIRRGDAQGCL